VILLALQVPFEPPVYRRVAHGAEHVDLAVFEMLHRHRDDEFQAVVVSSWERRYG
jgi:hypothetical protein